jgi:hypothetical protein
MKENYSIEDLTFQMDGMAVYKAKGKDGLAYALTVLTYTEEIICRLDPVKFEKGLRDLLSLTHRSLSKVTEGGVDERDQQVWVTHRWNAGRPLEDIVNRRAVEAEEMLKLKQDTDSMIAKLGDRADAVSFDPHFIFLGRTSQGELLTKYVIDYWQWFRDWALGSPFGGGRDAAREMGKLLKSLDGGVRTPVSRPAAPAPQTKGPMIVLPGESYPPKGHRPLCLLRRQRFLPHLQGHLRLQKPASLLPDILLKPRFPLRFPLRLPPLP